MSALDVTRQHDRGIQPKPRLWRRFSRTLLATAYRVPASVGISVTVQAIASRKLVGRKVLGPHLRTMENTQDTDSIMG